MVSTANAINIEYVIMFCVARQESLAKNGLERIAGANEGDFSKDEIIECIPQRRLVLP